MKASIVTISFNQAQFLERAIRSVLEQDYGDIEYIVVDAGSTDGSREIIERYRDRIAKVIFEPDEGPVDGLNKGFERASGEIFGYINSDDAYLPGAIGKAVAALRARSDADVVCGHGYIVDHEGVVLRRFRSDPFDARRYALGGVVVMQQSTFFRRAAFETVGGFNPQNKTSWDGELMLEMSLAGMRFTVVDDYWSVFRIHETSISGSQRMRAESRRNRDRYFQRVMGRPRRRSDWVLKFAARLEKWMLDPVGFGLRLRDKLIGAPRMRLV